MTRRPPAHINPHLAAQAIPQKIVAMVRTALTWKRLKRRDEAAGLLRAARRARHDIALRTWLECR